MTSFGVVGDVHGNARALRAALAKLREAPLDHLIFIGDLLTYGNDVGEVLDLVEDAQRTSNATLLVGNHDQMYFDVAEGERTYFEKLPPWIRESVELTLERLDMNRFRTRLRWSVEHRVDDVYFAHANPFGPGDWAYLNTDDDLEKARVALEAKKVAIGVFGHTHRPRWCVSSRASAPREVPRDIAVSASRDETVVANAGSVGQPREDGASAVVMRFMTTNDGAEATFSSLDYDVAGHLASLLSAGMTEATTARLCAFFAKPRASLSL